MRSRSKRRRATSNLSPSQRNERGWRGLKQMKTALCPNLLTHSRLVCVCGVQFITSCSQSYCNDAMPVLSWLIFEKAVLVLKKKQHQQHMSKPVTVITLLIYHTVYGHDCNNSCWPQFCLLCLHVYLFTKKWTSLTFWLGQLLAKSNSYILVHIVTYYLLLSKVIR